MIELKDMIDILPKYQRKSAYGGVGDVKDCVVFSYYNDGNYHYQDLPKELIKDTIVKSIEPIGSAYGTHCRLGLWLNCEKKSEKEKK